MQSVTVVIPLYNKGPYIERAIRSVLCQTFQDFEVIVVDDGSSDRGPEVVESLSDPRLRMIRQQNTGVSAARNRGIDEAESDLVAFLDADDAWYPEFLETILRLRQKFPQAGAYATAYQIRYPNGNVVLPKFKAIPPPPWEGLIPRYFRSALGPPPVSSSAVAIPKSVFEEVGKFVVGEPLGEDLDMWGRIALKYSIAFSWKVGATYFYYWKLGIRFGRSESLPFGRRADRLLRDCQLPKQIVIDLKNYVDFLRLVEASNLLVQSKERKLARKKLRRLKPESLLLRLRKYWWLTWSMAPSWAIEKAFWLKQQVLSRT